MTQCRTCKHAQEDRRENGEGRKVSVTVCKRYPPVLMDLNARKGQILYLQPVVQPTDGCGEHKPKSTNPF